MTRLALYTYHGLPCPAIHTSLPLAPIWEKKAQHLSVSHTDSPNRMENSQNYTEGSFTQQVQTRYHIASKCLKFVWHLCIESWGVSDTLASYCGGMGWGVWGRGQRASPTFWGIIYFVLSLFTTLVLDSISESSVHIKRQFQTTSAWVYSLLIFYLKEWSWRFLIAFVH